MMLLNFTDKEVNECSESKLKTGFAWRVHHLVNFAESASLYLYELACVHVSPSIHAVLQAFVASILGQLLVHITESLWMANIL